MRANPKVCVEIDEIATDSRKMSIIVNGGYQELPEPQYANDGSRARKLLKTRYRLTIRAQPASADGPAGRSDRSAAVCLPRPSRQLAENIDQVFWMLDLGTLQMLYVSSVFEKVWGCSSADLDQNRDRLVESVHAEDRGGFQMPSTLTAFQNDYISVQTIAATLHRLD